jgi:hypothetical protein
MRRHPENRSQGSETAAAAPKASLTAGFSHHLHHIFGYGYVNPDAAIVLFWLFISEGPVNYYSSSGHNPFPLIC